MAPALRAALDGAGAAAAGASLARAILGGGYRGGPTPAVL
jgi:hypothetical protein